MHSEGIVCNIAILDNLHDTFKILRAQNHRYRVIGKKNNSTAYLLTMSPFNVLTEMCAINYVEELAMTVNAGCFVALDRVVTIMIVKCYNHGKPEGTHV